MEHGQPEHIRRLRVKRTPSMGFGTVWVNDHLPISAEMPHGGFEDSGFGKVVSLYALDDCSQIKRVMLDRRRRATQGMALHHRRRSRLMSYSAGVDGVPFRASILRHLSARWRTSSAR
jgi:hypothetical protein